jgi:hypothetical protein
MADATSRTHNESSTAMVRARHAFVLVAVLLCTGCANLDAVREFGKTAAQISNYPDAGLAFESSAGLTAPFRASPPVQADRVDVRTAQVDRALKVQAALSGYFATLAKLAGEDSFTLDAELDHIGKGLASLPDAATSSEVEAAVSLTKIAAKYVLAERQASAVKALVHDGGPHADKIMDALLRVTQSWQKSVENDKSVATSSLDILASGKDTQPLPSLLAKDRSAQLNSEYAALLTRIKTAHDAMSKVKATHTAMESAVDHVSPRQWTNLLKSAVADMKLAKQNIQALH